MSVTSVDLPEPLTPVTAMNCPSGKPTVRLRRLCSRAPCTTSSRPVVCGRRARGGGDGPRPGKDAPGGDSLLALGLPEQAERESTALNSRHGKKSDCGG